MRRQTKYPLLTIITPSYNRASYLQETIESVLSQNYPDIEYIVLDDGSKDNIREVVRKYKSKIIFISHKNIGETKTVNKGLSLARGEIVGIVNSDDPLLPGAVRAIVAFMQKNPRFVAVYPDWTKIDQSGNTIERVSTQNYDYVYMIRTHQCIPGPATFFRKSLLQELSGRDEKFRYVADFDFYLRAGLIGKFSRIPRFLAAHRIHAEGITIQEKGRKMALEHIQLLDKLYKTKMLPASVLRVKHEAYSMAYFTAALCSKSAVDKIYFALISFFLRPNIHIQRYYKKYVLGKKGPASL